VLALRDTGYIRTAGTKRLADSDRIPPPLQKLNFVAGNRVTGLDQRKLRIVQEVSPFETLSFLQL
jgi:hypothetical protein